MKREPENICHCLSNVPVFLHTSLPGLLLNCMQCKNSVLLDLSISDELMFNSRMWAKVYNSLFSLWEDSIKYKEWAKQQLLDENGSINLDSP